MNMIAVGDLTVNDKFDKLLHELHPHELEALRESVIENGITDPIKVWGDTIVDGHNRYRIAKEYGMPEVPIQPMYFSSELEAEIWILKNQIGRRNILEQMRALYRGQLFQKLQQSMTTSEAVTAVAEQYSVTPRTVFRDANLADALNKSTKDVQDRFLSGKLTAKDIIEDVKPVPQPEPYSKEEHAKRARKVFPVTVRGAAERVITAINNLKTLSNDLHLIFTNQGEKLSDVAPELAQMSLKLQQEESEARALTEFEYEK